MRHEVRHGGDTEVVYVNQGAADGWVSLGELDFAAGGYQSVAMFDNADGPVEAGQHIVFDALRITPCDDEACGEVNPGEPPGQEPEPEPGDDGTDDGEAGSGGQLTGGGCASGGGARGGSGPGGAAWMLPLVAALLVRRRRR